MSFPLAHRGSRQLGVVAIALILSPWGLLSQQAQAEAPPAEPVCQHSLQPGDQHEFACALPARKPDDARRYTFSVRLSGGHDDSSSALALSWQGQALACEDGSKTSSDGEDGDIVLSCRFRLPASTANVSAPLNVQLKASHVVFEGLSLQAMSAGH